jgi:hypothetical protein
LDDKGFRWDQRIERKTFSRSEEGYHLQKYFEAANQKKDLLLIVLCRSFIIGLLTSTSRYCGSSWVRP